MTPPVPPLAAVEIAREVVLDRWDGTPYAREVAEDVVAALAAAGLLDPDARLRDAVAALRAKTDPRGGVPWLEPELGAVFAVVAGVGWVHPPEYVAELEAEIRHLRTYKETAPVLAKMLDEVDEALGVADASQAERLARIALLLEPIDALDAAPAETGEQLAARLADRMRARDAAGSGEAWPAWEDMTEAQRDAYAIRHPPGSGEA